MNTWNGEIEEGEEGEEGEGSLRTSPFSFIFSSSLYGAYHFARRVLPLGCSSVFKTWKLFSWNERVCKRDWTAQIRGNILPVLD